MSEQRNLYRKGVVRYSVEVLYGCNEGEVLVNVKAGFVQW